ncbi:MAG: hypothetical protein MJD61_06380 [Proteobacteria bacterium]|nr:hypothetical protein [Pseudomonadota bacterium]
MAGPFDGKDFEKLVPADKKLSKVWLRSLRARGVPARQTGGALRWIGMPIGGICAGQLYLGGDGKLWLWNIFESVDTSDYAGGISRGHDYARPLVPDSPLEQGFAVRARTPGGSWQARALDKRGFKSISFLGQYPIAEVEYGDASYPVKVHLEAFSPFVPLDVESSAFPATILSYTIANPGPAPVEVELMGWLENAVCLGRDGAAQGNRRNAVEAMPDRTTLFCSADNSASSVPGFGSMALTLVGAGSGVRSGAQVDAAQGPEPIFDRIAPGNLAPAASPFGTKLVGALGSGLTLAPGQTATVPFVISWFFPDYHVRPKSDMSAIRNIQSLKRNYATRFRSASDVAGQVVARLAELTNTTRQWRATWYDSTLPYWFLDRTFVNVSTLATQTCHWFDNGRFWGWEGVDCCPGTCQHVWQYAQSVARLFPSLERGLREHIDFGLAWQSSGAMGYRGDSNNTIAHDGFCGTILRVYREHQMSADDAFLRRLWPRVKTSMQHITVADTNGDGILDHPQYNTLDGNWYGQIPWISSLYIAAARATQAMAEEMGDAGFAMQLATIVQAGYKNIPATLYDGEYFIQKVDPAHRDAINSNKGCHIDQVLGQSYAFQLGLGRILPELETRSALRSLWRYNFSPDVGPFREKSQVQGGRWYALAGEGGLIMTTFPKGGAVQAQGRHAGHTWAGYLNECWTGQEYQVASHMLWEGMVDDGLAITRMIHDRHHPLRRNPYNEVECSSHYVRAMASHGVYLAACGFEYHGPRGYLGFHPKLSPEAFRAAFVGAEGWGTFSQQRVGRVQSEQIDIKYGQLRLAKLGFELAPSLRPSRVTVQGADAVFRLNGSRLQVDLAPQVTLRAGDSLRVEIHS